MSKTKVEENEAFTLNNIINFIGSVEQGTASCTWTSAKQLPREISLLDNSRLQLNASTNLVINMSRMLNSIVRSKERTFMFSRHIYKEK